MKTKISAEDFLLLIIEGNNSRNTKGAPLVNAIRNGDVITIVDFIVRGDVKCQEIRVQTMVEIISVEFENLEFNNTTFPRDFIIKNCEIKKLIIEGINLNRLNITGCKIFEGIFIGNSPAQELFISLCNSEKFVFTSPLYKANLEYNTVNEILIQSASAELNLNGGIVQTLTLSNIIGSVLFHQIEIGATKIENVNLSVFKIIKLRNLKIITFQSGSVNNFHIEHSGAGKGEIDFAGTKIKNSAMFFNDIDTITFRNELSSSSRIIMHYSKVNNLKFLDFTNRGSFIMAGVFVLKSLHIIRSNLANTDLIMCKFEHSDFYFENSKVSELFLAETDFPKKVRDKTGLNFGKAQLAFGQ
jgi:uncharacterized protein YjbI with pentapeptide repeats